MPCEKLLKLLHRGDPLVPAEPKDPVVEKLIAYIGGERYEDPRVLRVQEPSPAGKKLRKIEAAQTKKPVVGKIIQNIRRGEIREIRKMMDKTPASTARRPRRRGWTGGRS